MIDLDRRQRVTLTWAAIALVITAFEGSVLVIALPAVATEFHASTPALSDLLSVLAIGTLGALPLSTLADRFGRKRLIAVGVAGSSLANLASGFAPSIAILAFFKLFAVCFEVLVAGVVTALIVRVIVTTAVIAPTVMYTTSWTRRRENRIRASHATTGGMTMADK